MAAVRPFYGAARLMRSLVRPHAARPYSQPAPLQSEGCKQPLGYPWRVVVAVCVQRLPSLGRETPAVERQYREMKEQVRAERSRLSDFELQEREVARLKRERERRATEDEVLQESPDQAVVEEFEELGEAREQEMAEFQPALRITEADRSGDLQSMERKLDKMLYLLVKKKRTSHAWQMPQGSLVEGESLLQAAKRELSEDCGSELKVDFLSSAPSSFLSYHHPHPSTSGIIGSKVFFLKAQYRGGAVSVNQTQGLVDHMWLTKKEMKDYVSDSYFSAVASTLTD